ncbi:MAG: hypothetical protein ACK5PW_10085 [Burkholderiales bacterium]|jgi:hypothetical protein
MNQRLQSVRQLRIAGERAPASDVPFVQRGPRRDGFGVPRPRARPGAAASGGRDLDEAYEVTAFVLSKPRPVKAHLEVDFPARWNTPIDAAFPPYMPGASADQHRCGPFPPLAAKQREMADRRAADLAAGKACSTADRARAATGK